MTPVELESQASTMANGATEDDIVFIEAAFSTDEVARSYQVIDSLISGMLIQTPIRESSCQILIFLHSLPNRVDQIHDLLGVPELEGRIAVVDRLGRFIGDRDLARIFATKLTSDPDTLGSDEGALLRHRGVFRSSTFRREQNYLFYYEALNEATNVFQQLLLVALQRVPPDVVIFDSSTSGQWFASMVQAACVELQATGTARLTSFDISQWIAYHEGTLAEPQKSRIKSAVKVLSDPNSRVAVVVPAYSSGRSLTRAFEAVGVDGTDLSRCTAIAVFADESATLESSPLPNLQVARQPYAGKSVDVHCMRQVQLRALDRDNWLFEAAAQLEEVRELPVEKIDLTNLGTVALWSLFDDYGVGVETLPAGGRAPKQNFPQLADLDNWDAHWLAQAAVVNISKHLPQSNQEAMLIVIPEEQNGTRPISQALLNKCGVAVLQIPRPMIDGDVDVTPEIRQTLHMHRAETITVLDESTVTYGTLVKLVKIIDDAVHVQPDLVGAIIDMTTDPPPFDIPFFSLAQWAAAAEEAS